MHHYHCSLSAIGANTKSNSRRRFIPPPRKIVQVPWRTPQELTNHVGFIPGEWKLSINQWGHIQGLPHVEGALIARLGARALLWDGGTGVRIISGSNFIGHHEEEETE